MIVSPEPPYPLHGGGAYRTAALVHYFAQIAPVDLIYISNTGQPALLPEGLVRSQSVIALPPHGNGKAARYFRNAMRAGLGVPPLIDRMSGLGGRIEEAIAGRRYEIGVIEHFWCAPYVEEISRAASRTVLDMHNVESVLHERCAASEGGLAALGHRRFAPASRNLEAKLLPRFDAVLAASEEDAAQISRISPAAKTMIWPNALPMREIPRVERNGTVGFSGNFEYHPNIDAVRFLVNEIWPLIRLRYPDLKLRLIGRGDHHIRGLIRHDNSIEATGQIEDAMAEIAACEVVIAPLRAGSGTRIKILEAWAAARPVVATRMAAEGLSATHNDNCLLEDAPEQFASAVVYLLDSSQERERIGMRARRTFEHCYTWRAAWDQLDFLLQVLRSEEL